MKINFRILIINLFLLILVSVLFVIGYFFFKNQKKQAETINKISEPLSSGSYSLNIDLDKVLKAKNENQNFNEFSFDLKNALNNDVAFEDLQKIILGENGRYKNIPVLAVKDETIYGNDLNYYCFIYGGDLLLKDDDDKEKLERIFYYILKDSIVLQNAAKKKLILLDQSFFNNQNKDYQLRNEKVQLAEQLYYEKMINENNYLNESEVIQNVINPEIKKIKYLIQ
jgi:hypothetical protein